jgi:hypothetical protein
LPETPYHLIPFLEAGIETHGEVEESGEAYGAGYVGAGDLGGMEEEFVHEAMWGNDKEDGVGEEQEGDMD